MVEGRRKVDGHHHQPPRPIPAAGKTRISQIVEVRFQGLRSDYYAYRGEKPLRDHEYVVVEADRGQDLGWVRHAVDGETHSCEGGCDHAHHGPVVPPSKRVLRRAAPVDVKRRVTLNAEEPELRRRTRELVKQHGLRLKVSEAEWQWDRNKLTIYFTADKRVDFRDLVKEMARTFKTRIELRQIGVRDEAKRLGGLGRCGRELCCRLWLPHVEPVTLQLAKDQGLSLNPAQISGACGRLMSCLHYEHDFYLQAKKRFPKVGRRIATDEGEAEVVGWDIFQDTVALRDGAGDLRTVSLDSIRRKTASSRSGTPQDSRSVRGRPGDRTRAPRKDQSED
jgi:cell fate regulator YaaT (PSP1 superfamily)